MNIAQAGCGLMKAEGYQVFQFITNTTLASLDAKNAANGYGHSGGGKGSGIGMSAGSMCTKALPRKQGTVFRRD
jgi:hypothetical protein